MNVLPSEKELTDEQVTALRASDNQDQIVLGVAGGGKTVIAIYRSIMLSNSSLFEPKRVLILTYNDAIHSFIRGNVKQQANDTDNVDVNTVYTYFKELVNTCRPTQELKNLNEHEYQFLQSANNRYDDYVHNRSPYNKRGYNYYPEATAMDKNVVNKMLDELIDEAKKEHPDNNIWKKDQMSYKDIKLAIRDEINWMQDNEIPYNDEAAYLNADRIGRSSFNLGNKGGIQRKLVYDIYYQYYEKRDSYRTDRGVSKIFDYNDVYRLVKYLDIPENQKYDYVIVDEVQDLSPVMFEALNQIRKRDGNTYFTLLGDLSQNIFGRRMSWKKLGLQVNRGNSHRIKHNYRNTYEISKLGKDFLDYCKLHYSSDVESASYKETESTFIEPELSTKHSYQPYAVNYSKSDYIVRFLNRAVKANEDSLIICRNDRDKREITNLLKQNDIAFKDEYGKDDDEDDGTANVYVLGMNKIKGLQFPNVLFYCIDSMPSYYCRDEILNMDSTVKFEMLNDEEANRFYAQEYVGITRSENMLMLVYRNPQTINLLKEIGSDSIRYIQ
ncbi:UvrD-helicase domain-containing protein [Nicoliella spurrieriana]|uniref:UvrD-helicase domain-containing protein n=1 Tax=Nicoliella spurrieriana TaxID=2925830 RepID=A0A976RSD8_9LACO|nr:UvrD-helicase domain-containing protein [Nicoliella spurrieriana]UQS86890.1 UvrD-helicase domain-containing protein [Nicoliella spurrieriana]